MLNPKLPIIIRFPLCIDQLQREADAICDLSMGLSLEEIVNDSAAIYLGNQSIECWLEYVENTIWYEHVSNDSYYEIKSFCSTFMQYLLDKYKLLNLLLIFISLASVTPLTTVTVIVLVAVAPFLSFTL